MKKKRALPFGYTIENGRRIIDSTEAATIQQIFTEYQNGATMSELAAMMTRLQIPYCEKRVDWNKTSSPESSPTPGMRVPMDSTP